MCWGLVNIFALSERGLLEMGGGGDNRDITVISTVHWKLIVIDRVMFV